MTEAQMRAARAMRAALESLMLYEDEDEGTFLTGDVKKVRAALAAAKAAGIGEEP